VIVDDDPDIHCSKSLPTTNSPQPYNGCVAWTFIAMNGRILDALEERFFKQYIPPTLPR
jgi:hypothetical protein